jgi:hypothetical protein
MVPVSFMLFSALFAPLRLNSASLRPLRPWPFILQLVNQVRSKVGHPAGPDFLGPLS